MSGVPDRRESRHRDRSVSELWSLVLPAVALGVAATAIWWGPS